MRLPPTFLNLCVGAPRESLQKARLIGLNYDLAIFRVQAYG